MNKTTQTIFENYQIRKTKKQKEAFINWLSQYVTELGYECHTEKGSMGSKNIIIGNPETAKVVFTAHYDTCAQLPFPNFITPKSILLYLLYQIIITVPIIAVSVIAAETIKSFFPYFDTPSLDTLFIFAILSLIMFGPANKHTANDNTSGVTTVVDILTKMPDNCRSDAAYILFDMEEVGLVGSKSYYKKHKKIMKNKLLINFDCVSDGNDIIVYAPKKSAAFSEHLKFAFQPDKEITTQVLTEGVFYPSDQVAFPYGVGVAAFKKTKRGLLYMDKIHTAKDVVYDEKNIDYLCKCSIRLTEILNVK